jgi:hypothetical protein
MIIFDVRIFGLKKIAENAMKMVRSIKNARLYFPHVLSVFFVVVFILRIFGLDQIFYTDHCCPVLDFAK